MRAGEWASAEANVRRAISVIDSGLVLVPGDTVAQTFLGRALMYLGDALGAGDDGRSLPRVQAARDAYTRALSVELGILAHARRSTSVLTSVSHAYTRMGYVDSWTAEITGDTAQLAAAVANHRAAQWVRHEIVAADSSSYARRALADGWMDIANTEQPLGHLHEALALLDSAGPIFTALARADTANVEARRDLAFYSENRGAVLLSLGHSAQAVTEERAAIQSLARLQRSDPGSVEEYYHLVHAQETLGDALALHATPSAAIAAYEAASATVVRWKHAAPSAAQPARLEREIGERIAKVANGPNDNERRDQ